MTKKIPEFLTKAFKSEDLKTIIEKKCVGNQTRDVVLKAPQTVEISADECKRLCKKNGIKYEEGYEHRVIQYTCSDETVDRYGDVIKAKGWQLDNYKKNPVILGFHNYGSFPVGSSLKTTVDGKVLKMQILFAGKEVSPEADQTFKLAKSGFMKAGSVGFMPLESRAPTEAERTELGMDNQWGVIYEKSDLMEFSVCGVPANPNTVQDAIQKGVLPKSWVDNTTPEKEIPGTVEKEIPAPVVPVVAKEVPVVPVVEKEVPEVAETTILSILQSPVIKQLVNQAVEQAIETKIGATISKKNKDLLTGAIKAIRDAATNLEQVLANAESTTETETDETKAMQKETQKVLDLLTIDDEGGDNGGLDYAEILDDILKLD